MHAPRRSARRTTTPTHGAGSQHTPHSLQTTRVGRELARLNENGCRNAAFSNGSHDSFQYYNPALHPQPADLPALVTDGYFMSVRQNQHRHLVPHELHSARVLTARRGTALADAVRWRVRGAWRFVRRCWFHDHAWLGLLVELSGNWVELDGCRFDVSHPQITRGLRARLLRGRYERSERELLKDWLDTGSPVIELGGGIGVVATLVNRRLRDRSRHVVLEANPSLIGVIERQKAVNGGAFTVVHGAVDYSGAKMVHLHVDGEFLSGRVDGESGHRVAVPTVTLEELLRRYPWKDVTLVCDIEGGETQLVEKDGELLHEHCSLLIIEVHPEFRTAEQCAALFERLDALGFERVKRVRKVHAFRRRRLLPDLAS